MIPLRGKLQFSHQAEPLQDALSNWPSGDEEVAVVLAKALHYSRATERDERNGFPYTAAMEWRHAAELFESGNLAVDYCWRQWERIMPLPRQLAVPVSSPQHVLVPLNPTSARSVMREIPWATAA
jgi:hypothetical protein